MFWNRNKISKDMIQNIRPTSKVSLKMSCLYTCNGDVDKAYRPVPWDEYITVGSYGDPTKATPEKGKAFLEAAIAQIVHIIRDVMP